MDFSEYIPKPRRYSKKIFKYWEDFLIFCDYDYVAAKRTGNLYYQDSMPGFEEQIIFRIKVGEHGYCVYAKMPVQVVEDNQKAVVDYILFANSSCKPVYFMLKCDTGEVFCVYDTAKQETKVKMKEVLKSILHIDDFMELFGEGLAKAANMQ